MTFNTFLRLSIAIGLFLVLFQVMEFLSITTSKEVSQAKHELGILHEHNHEPTHTQVSEPKDTQLLSASKVNFNYFPDSLEIIVTDLTQSLSEIIYSAPLKNKIASLSIDLYGNSQNLRGQMKQGHIKLFGVREVDHGELISIFVHELSHYIDIYFLKKKVFQDPSNQFYAISWLNTNTIVGGQKNKDFVSGYAMSNKYEDFAESMTYYMFANEEMRQRAKNSFSMKQKYHYFENNVFKDGSFKGTNFSNQEAKRYYWDITKKGFDIKNFLEYIQKQV